MSFFLNIDRPSEKTNYWNTFAGNIFLILFSGGILLAAFLFPVDRLPLGFCVFLNLTCFPCPTCGFTRAFCAFVHGNWAFGVRNCPLALLLYLFTIAVFIYNAAVAGAALFGFRFKPGPILHLSFAKWKWIFIVSLLLLLANWTYRLALGLK